MSDFREILRTAYTERPLSPSHFEAVAEAATGGAVPDYQLAAWLAAVYIRALTPAETHALTMAMARSGGSLRPSPGQVDKHSTGGVGDKTTLVVAPAVASLGMSVAKMSGRGLGHTGGTLDKLESIPGFRVGLSRQEWEKVVAEVGVAVAAQTRELAPADGRLYALRDATATVDAPWLIASSIMSKKIAGGAPALVLDVKVGRGSFNPTLADARQLASLMLELAHRSGMRATAVLTDMDQPLGHAVGNALEVNEAWDILAGRGPADARQVSVAIAGAMVELVDPEGGPGAPRVEAVLQSGRAAEKFLEWVAAQGGDARQVEQGLAVAPASDVRLTSAGFVASIDPLRIGQAAMALGAGRAVKDAPINPRVGIRMLLKVGDVVNQSVVAARVYGESPADREAAAKLVRAAVVVGTEPVPARSAVLGQLTAPDDRVVGSGY